MEYLGTEKVKGLLKGESEQKIPWNPNIGVLEKTLCRLILSFVLVFLNLAVAIFHFLAWILAVEDKDVFSKDPKDPVRERLEDISVITAGFLCIFVGKLLYWAVSGLF